MKFPLPWRGWTWRVILSVLALLSGAVTGFGQAYDWKQVKLGGGGFVTGITFHPNVSGLMYCRTDIGGAYRWNPATNSWTQLLDFLGFDFWPNDESSLHGVESIGLDAQDPNRLYLACGWLSSPNEILISTNQGASFTRVDAPFQIRANNDGRGTGERFGVDPNLGGTIFYGTRSDGLWKSTNHAANWSKVASFPVNSTANGVGISFVEFVAGSGTPGSATPVIWVGVSQAGANLYRSVDGGLTWESVAHGAPAGHMPMRAAQDGQGNVYITFCDGAGPNGISAGSVRKINLGTLASTGVTPPSGNGGFGGVSVDRQNPNTVVVTTVNRWWPMSHIYRSTDGGASWSSVYSGTVDMSSAPYMNPDGGTVIEGWMFDIKIDPYNSDRVYYVTGGGVFSSYNFTAGQPSWEFRSDGIEEGVSATVGMNLACPPEGGPQLYSAFGDIGGFAHYDLDTSPPIEDIFFNPQGGNNYGVNFAEQSPNIIVRTYYAGSGRGGCISYDWGKTWTIFPTKPVPMTTEGPGYVALSADASRLVWAAPSNAPFYSTDNGATWNPSTGPSTLTPGSGGQDTLVADRVNPNKFYLYSPGTGRVFVSTDGGVSYTHTTTITGSWDHSMHTPFGQEGEVWIAVWNGLWRSTNSGTSFTKVSNVQAARSIGFGRTATGTGYPVAYLHGKVGGVWGVYRSENQGASWIRINDDQHQFGGIAQVIGDPKIYGRCYIKALGIHYGDIPNQAPPAPVNLVATASDSAVRLSWSNISTAESYTVKRSTIGDAYVVIASDLKSVSYVDTGVLEGATYYYVVAAANTFGASADSAQAMIVTPVAMKARYALEGTAQDTSGNGNHGTANALTYVAGKVGSLAAQFNGTGSYVSIPRSVSEDFTVTMWVKTTDTAGGAGAHWWSGKGLVDGEVGGGGADWGTAIVNGKFVLGVGSAASGDTTIASSVNINDGTWHHLAATRDNTTGTVALYVDGVLRGGGTGPTGDRTFPPGLRIGSLQTGGGFLNGALDDVRLYSRILSESELAALAAGPQPPAAPENLGATPGTAAITLSWDAADGATDYVVRRSALVGGPFTQIATGITTTGYEDTGLADGATWYYTVSANGAAGQGPESAPVSATTFTELENWRAEHFGTTADSGDAADAADPDGDGWTNLDEYIAGTGPNDPASLFKIAQLQAGDGEFTITFPSALGRTYTVERSYTLETGSWVALPGETPGTGETLPVTDTDPTESPRRFYRVVVTR